MLHEFTSTTHGPAAILLVSCLGWLFVGRRRNASHARLPPSVRGAVPVFGSLAFLSRFWSWHCEQQACLADFHPSNGDTKNPYKAASFKIGRMPVIDLAGPAARKEFFSNPSFDIKKGYELFYGMGLAEKPQGAHDDLENHDTGAPLSSLSSNYVVSRIRPLVSQERLQRRLPVLLSDVLTFVERLPSSGALDPHADVAALIALLSARTVGFQELAESSSLREVFTTQARNLLEPITPMARLFPWCILLPSIFSKLRAATTLCMHVRKLIRHRRESEPVEDDALQMLLGLKDNMFRVVAFVVASIAAAQESTSIVAAWMLIYLALYPEWRAKVLQEVENLAAAYATADLNMSLTERLKEVPVEAFQEAKIIGACVRETVRIVSPGPLCRYNAGPDISIGDYTIPSQTWLTYGLADAHYDPSVYPKPTTWDPSRHLVPPTKQNRDGLNFIGWGGGKHPCPGMKFAKLEIAIITAFFVADFDFDAIRRPSKGNHDSAPALKAEDIPPPDMDLLVPHPPSPKDRVWIRFSQRRTPQ